MRWLRQHSRTRYRERAQKGKWRDANVHLNVVTTQRRSNSVGVAVATMWSMARGSRETFSNCSRWMETETKQQWCYVMTAKSGLWQWWDRSVKSANATVKHPNAISSFDWGFSSFTFIFFVLGVSGSCSMQTCWRKLSGFNTTAAALRVKYHQAIRKLSFAKASRRAANRERRERLVTIGTGFNGRNFPGIGIGESLQDPSFEQLFYLEQSPTFCAVTKGRQCLSPDNCSQLCCGRGYTTRVIKQVEKCRCRFTNGRCCNVICDYCEKYEDRYYCK